MKNCVIVIPALNPADSFYEYVSSLSDQEFLSIIVINDGSSDDKQSIFDKCDQLDGVRVIQHAVNLGKGRALKNAFNYILNDAELHNANGVITVDADGQHKQEDVLAICQGLSKGGNKLILGVRSFDNENVPTKNRLGNTITRKLFKLLYGKSISDTQTGLRGFSLDTLSFFVALEGERFSYETNVLIIAVKKKMTIEETAIDTVYINENESSHFRPFQDSFEIYWLLFKNFFKFMGVSIASFLIDISLFQIVILLLRFTPASRRITVATILARAGSSLFNFCMNRSFVFKSKKKWNKTIIGYYTLVVAEALLSAGSVYMLYRVTGFRELFLKIGVDFLIFLVSYRVQKLIVFKD
ncbi:MAG: bifunctional glycosyltransferase family 2/GtrA family protein [Alkalibacterium sp.]|nr:bifunctional glycosyltransferase family 2/GtrA family protein [Alkalibacterium sp.]